MARRVRSRPQAVVPLADHVGASGRRDTQLGVLARAMATADRLGLVVPETWVVLADVFRHVAQTALPPGHDPGSLLRTIRRPVGVERAARARERLLSVTLDAEIEREIDSAFRALSEVGPWGIAVRASAIVVDAGVARAARLSITELAVSSRDELGRAMRRVWARAMSEPTLRYLRARRAREVALAIVLQPTVVARASATLITDARSIAGDGVQETDHRPERLVFAFPGLGVDADPLAAEVSAIDRAGVYTLVRSVGTNQRTVVQDGSLVAEPDPHAGEPIAESRAAELLEIARRLETLGPTEVRCVIPERGEIAVVDVQPSQHLGHPGLGTAQTLWARASAAEAPAQPLTPLSRELLVAPILASAARALHSRGRRASRVADALAMVEGRPYLDVSSLAGNSPGQDFVDAAGRIEISGAQLSPEIGRVRALRVPLARAGLRVAQMAAEQRVLADDVGRFEKDAETERRWLAEMDLAILPDDALTTTLHEVSGFLARAHDLHARATASAVSGHGLLASVLAGVDASRASFLAHAVTSGADVITARPASAFCHVASIARYDESVQEWLAFGSAPRPLRDLPVGPLARAMGRFLEAFGDRGLSEAELSTPRWAEDPTPLIALLAASLRGDAVDPDVALSRARALADRQLALLEPNLSFFETRLVRDIVSRVRDLLRLRERCRARVAHGLSMMRVVTLDVDRRIRRLDPELEPGAAFTLTLGELAAAVAKYRADLAPIVRARRADLTSQRRAAAPPSVFRGAPPSTYPIRSGKLLVGLPSSAGAADGRVVRVGGALEGIERFSSGDVLVVESLDLGLLPLILQANAVVAEFGTPFSSSSVVARDFGVPLVAGASGAWGLLRGGERVRVDGDAGTVESLGP
jgi:phosphohistidine swiveling domain-containing protein